jgi:trk system potassium uptake protein TrkA
MKIFIVGAGEVGRHIASSLTQEGHEIIVVEADLDKAQHLQSEVDVLAVTGDGCNARILEQHGIHDADLFFAVSNDDAANMLSALTARRLGVAKCVARVGNPYHGSSPLLADDPNIIPMYPERLVADEIKGLMRVPGVSKAHFFEDGKLVLLRVRPSARVDIYDKPLRDLEGPEGWILVGVMQGLKLCVPKGDTILRHGQSIYAVGHTETVDEFLTGIGVEAPPTRKVLIAGAGHVGSWLARGLVKDKIQVTVIQRKRQKAKALAAQIPEVLVLQGDATDPALLREAQVGEMDYFVAATQDDEANVISSFLARGEGARMLVTLYQRAEYLKVLRAAHVDIALNPRLVTAGTILRMVHRHEILSLDLVESGDAEVVEFEVPAKSKVLKAPLRKLNMPEDSIVGAVIRGDERYVPGGDFAFEVGDRALVFALAEALPKLEKLFRGQ